jgi:hypothetical protein
MDDDDVITAETVLYAAQLTGAVRIQCEEVALAACPRARVLRDLRLLRSRGGGRIGGSPVLDQVFIRRSFRV